MYRKHHQGWRAVRALFIVALVAAPAGGKTVICVDGAGDAFVSNHEGWARSQMDEDTDQIQVGGSLTDCLAMVADGDTLVIVAHGSGTGSGFIWNGTEYTGFGNGPNELPVPAGFGNLMNVTVEFCSCWSDRDPDGKGPDTSLTDKIIDAMGGAGNGHTATGFNDLATATVNYTVRGPDNAQAQMGVGERRATVTWMDNPPTNRTGATTTQATAAQEQLDDRFGDGVLTVEIDGYKQPVNEVEDPPPGSGAGGCSCVGLPGCGFGTQEGIPQAYAAGCPGAAPCNEPSGAPGCADPECCSLVCEQVPFCCLVGWDPVCVDIALDLGCAPEQGGEPACIATGPDPAQDGYCKVCPDPYGAWTSDKLAPRDADPNEWGDEFNPVGGLGLEEVALTHGFFFLRQDADERELLTSILAWQQAFPPDGSVSTQILVPLLGFDDNNDGVDDRLVSEYVITSVGGVNLHIFVEQTIANVASPSGLVAVVNQFVQITNTTGSPVEFTILRLANSNLIWDGDENDDSVGTGANGSSLEWHAYQDDGSPQTGVTISADEATEYTGVKDGLDPDGPDNPAPRLDGRGEAVWTARELPVGWDNFLAGVGYDMDGDSGPAPLGCIDPCNGATILRIPMTLAGAGPSSVGFFTFRTTYGANTPAGASNVVCLADCGDFNGVVDTTDFLALLAQWGQVGSCDISDPPGIDTIDFLALLAEWGPCP